MGSILLSEELNVRSSGGTPYNSSGTRFFFFMTKVSRSADANQYWTDASRAILNKLTASRSDGRIMPEDVATLTRAEETSFENVMLRLLPVATSYARPPISNFHVGAAALAPAAPSTSVQISKLLPWRKLHWTQRVALTRLTQRHIQAAQFTSSPDSRIAALISRRGVQSELVAAAERHCPRRVRAMAAAT